MNIKNIELYSELVNVLLTRKGDNDKTAASCLSLLNTLGKAGLFTPANFPSVVSNRKEFERDVARWLTKNQRRSLTTQKSRLKAILKIYDTQVITQNLEFTELLQHSFRSHFGEFRIKGSNRGAILRTEACKKVVESFIAQGLRVSSGAEKETLEQAKTRSVTQIFRWLAGRCLPGQQFRPAYTNALDIFFGHELGTFERSLPKRNDANVEIDDDKQPRRTSRKTIPLPTDVERQFQVFARLKINGIRPKTVNYQPHEKPGEPATLVRNTSKKGNWTENAEGKCETQNHAHSVLRGFFSFLQSDAMSATWSSPEKLSLAHLADTPALDAYVDACVERKWSMSNLKFLLGLLDQMRRSSGYLRRGIEPLEGLSAKDWFAHLDNLTDTIDVYKDVLSHSKHKIEVDPTARIRFVVEEPPQKAHAIMNALNNALLARSRDASLDRKRRYERSAAALIFQLSRVSPLRAANWPRLNYFEGHKSAMPRTESYLAKDVESGNFRIYVPILHLKNRNRPSVVPVDTPVPEQYREQIEEYLAIRREKLPPKYKRIDSSGSGEALFLVNDAEKFVNIEQATCAQLSRWFQKHTGEAIEEALPHISHAGINMHAMRHLVATLFLNDNPGNYVALATLLNDTLEVVLATYAKINHLHQADFICAWADGCATERFTKL